MQRRLNILFVVWHKIKILISAIRCRWSLTQHESELYKKEEVFDFQNVKLCSQIADRNKLPQINCDHAYFIATRWHCLYYE